MKRLRKGMDWLQRVAVIADTDRVLHEKALRRRSRWSAVKTARRLRVAPSLVSMCVTVSRGLQRYPDLAGEVSLRKAYETYLKKRQEPVAEPSDAADW